MVKRHGARKFNVVIVRDVPEEDLPSVVGGLGGTPVSNEGGIGAAMGDKSRSSPPPAQRIGNPATEAQEPIDCGDDRCPIDPTTAEPTEPTRSHVGRQSRRHR
jgi:hypothetical protein